MIEPREVSGPLSQIQCQRIIGEAHQQRLRNCYRIAWGRYSAMKPEDRKDMTSRARANVIHDFAAAQATVEFAQLREVKIVDNRDSSGYFFLIFRNDIVLRFKKFRDDSFGTSSIVTKQQQQFALQQPPIIGIGDTTNLIVGYLYDEFETRMDVIAIKCSIGERVQWIWDITRHEIKRDSGDLAEQSSGPSQPRISSSEAASRLRPPIANDEIDDKNVDGEQQKPD